MPLKLLVIKDFSYLKLVVFYLIHIIVKKVKMVLLDFVDIKLQLNYFTKNQIQLWLKKMKMVGQFKQKFHIFVIGILV